MSNRQDQIKAIQDRLSVTDWDKWIITNPTNNQVKAKYDELYPQASLVYTPNGKLGLMTQHSNYMTFQEFPSKPSFENKGEAQKELTKYFLYKTLDNWIYEKPMNEIFKYLKVVDGKVILLKTQDEIINNKLSEQTKEDLEKKVDFINEYILTKNDIRKILSKMVERGYEWYDIKEKYKHTLKYYITKYLTSKIKKVIMQ